MSYESDKKSIMPNDTNVKIFLSFLQKKLAISTQKSIDYKRHRSNLCEFKQ